MTDALKPPPTHPATSSQTLTEKVGQYWETLRLWMTQAWRIAFLMAKGAYLSQERRTLFGKLGEEVYYKILKGELRNTELQNHVKDIERLTKKLEISEIRIRSLRFGQRLPSRSTPESVLRSDGGDLS